MTSIKVIRGYIIAGVMTFRVPAEIFTRTDFGETRLDTARKLLVEYLGIEVEEINTMQVIPVCGEVEIRLRS